MGQHHEDTVISPVFRPSRITADQLCAALNRTADALRGLTCVLSSYPKRRPEVWQSAAWTKDLKDFEMACELLTRHADELQRLADET